MVSRGLPWSPVVSRGLQGPPIHEGTDNRYSSKVSNTTTFIYEHVFILDVDLWVVGGHERPTFELNAMMHFNSIHAQHVGAALPSEAPWIELN